VAAPTLPNLREILACLMCSRLYFELRLTERLALVKSLASQMEDQQTGR
jgi:hypothetical protein